MYAVIFRAKIRQLDDEYTLTAAAMRQLAFDRYGCIDFIAVTEGDDEVAISYWPSEEAIRAWKQDPEHQLAQAQGRSQWYRSYSVEIVEVQRRYASP